MDIRKIRPLFIKQGFLEASWVNLKESLSFEVYKSQIWAQNFGSMEFLKTHTKLKDPKQQTSTKRDNLRGQFTRHKM